MNKPVGFDRAPTGVMLDYAEGSLILYSESCKTIMYIRSQEKHSKKIIFEPGHIPYLRSYRIDRDTTLPFKVRRSDGTGK